MTWPEALNLALHGSPEPARIFRDAALVLLSANERFTPSRLAGRLWCEHSALREPFLFDGELNVALGEASAIALTLLRSSARFREPSDPIFPSLDPHTFGHPLVRESISRIVSRLNRKDNHAPTSDRLHP